MSVRNLQNPWRLTYVASKPRCWCGRVKVMGSRKVGMMQEIVHLAWRRLPLGYAFKERLSPPVRPYHTCRNPGFSGRTTRAPIVVRTTKWGA